jgi:hypothetical protein
MQTQGPNGLLGSSWRHSRHSRSRLCFSPILYAAIWKFEVKLSFVAYVNPWHAVRYNLIFASSHGDIALSDEVDRWCNPLNKSQVTLTSPLFFQCGIVP